jgi:hypothetical protein
MAHFTCLACRARVWRDGPAADHQRDLCPGCGGPLEAADRAEQVLGLRALRTRPRTGPPIADRVRETIARNDAARLGRLRAENGDKRPRDA